MADSTTRQARFLSGDPVMAPYTPGGTVNPGDVIVQNNVPCIAHVGMVAGENGALAVGGGLYRCACAAAIAAGKAVWWDDTNNRLTETATSNTHFGFTVAASDTGDTLVNAKHEPQGLTGAIV